MPTCWEALRRDLNQSLSTLRTERAFLELGRAYPELGVFSEPGDLIATLRMPVFLAEVKDRWIRSLARAVVEGVQPRVATELLWIALWPGLDAIYWRQRRRLPSEAEELVSELSECFLQALHNFRDERVQRVAATLVRNTERLLVDARQRWLAEQARLSSLCDLGEADHPCTERRGESSLGLERGQDHADELRSAHDWLQGAIGPDADLLCRVMLLGQSQVEVGRGFGLDYEAVRKRVQRARTKLERVLSKKLSQTPRRCRI